MKEPRFAYRSSKGGLIILPILLSFCAIAGQSSLTSGKASQPTLVLAVVCLLYGLVALTLVWAIAWFIAPPVISADMDQVTIKNGLFEDARTIRWVDIQTARYRIKTVFVEDRTTKSHVLDFMVTGGDTVTLRLDLIDVSYPKIQAQITAIAPHIIWQIED